MYNTNSHRLISPQSHQAVYGQVTSTSGEVIVDAHVSVQNGSEILQGVKTMAQGDYYKLVVAGTYTVTVTAEGYSKQFRVSAAQSCDIMTR